MYHAPRPPSTGKRHLANPGGSRYNKTAPQRRGKGRSAVKTSTEIWSASRHVGYEKAVELIARAGFDAYDLSMFEMCRIHWDTGERRMTGDPMEGPDSLHLVRQIRRAAEGSGIRCNQSHAPFPSDAPPVRDCLKRAIEYTAEAGGGICVIHPLIGTPTERNVEFFGELLPFAKSHGVKIATENMYTWDRKADHSVADTCGDPQRFTGLLDAVGDPFLVACLDIGHAEMLGSGTCAPEMIRALGPERLCALHVHDNDKLHDSHQIPGSMQIDFEAVTAALRETGYRGYLTLEADQYLGSFSDEDTLRGLTDMARAARRLADAAAGE